MGDSDGNPMKPSELPAPEALPVQETKPTAFFLQVKVKEAAALIRNNSKFIADFDALTNVFNDHGWL